MTTILQYSKYISRLSNFTQYILDNHTVTVNYTVIDTGKNNQNNSISIEFNSILDQTTIDAINTSVKTYTNPIDPVIDFSNTYPLVPTKIVSTDYTKVSSFSFNPNVGSLSIININSFKNSKETFDYSLRILDLTNGKVIQEQSGLNNIQESNVSLNTLNNIPNTNSIFEIQAKLDSTNTTGGIIVNSFELIYCQT